MCVLFTCVIPMSVKLDQLRNLFVIFEVQKIILFPRNRRDVFRMERLNVTYICCPTESHLLFRCVTYCFHTSDKFRTYVNVTYLVRMKVLGIRG